MADTLTLSAKKAGMAELQASRVNKTIVRIPDTAIVGIPQNVTVT